eukprot:TRINITY_DN12169_c0_g1_i1.p1 TRINITY_DN12169_c0_g1~~TRINITY_DN12169_c0_g1_i1.p1  ORF type:complete len:484 (-),score=106.65 TRINITY_DN12169_c0_g1_i1:36-1361(-)
MAKKFKVKEGYPPLFRAWDSFYTRRMFKRIKDCWDRPVSSVPGPWITVKERATDDYNESFYDSGNERECLNLGSYNYLGFSDQNSPCLGVVQESIEKYGISACSPRSITGTTDLHRQVEIKTADYLGREDCITFGMGYHTNASTIPALVGHGDLIISDSLNHASLVAGCRASGAKVKVFPHNEMDELENIVKNAIVYGHPRTRRRWKKILILVEGIYSMEGEICNLPGVVAIKKKYGCYLWVDEAHSIGALGDNGRGVCEQTGVDPNDVDLLMGTYTKSFAAVGGYICGDKDVIDHIRRNSFGTIYSTSMTPPCCQQIISSMSIISGDDGTDLGKKKIAQLRSNSNLMRKGLLDRGFQIYGDDDSPVIPLMLYYPCKIGAFSREALLRNIAVVVVGYPACPLLMSRVRFCLSASHTTEDLEWALEELDEIGTRLKLKYGNH